MLAYSNASKPHISTGPNSALPLTQQTVSPRCGDSVVCHIIFARYLRRHIYLHSESADDGNVTCIHRHPLARQQHLNYLHHLPYTPPHHQNRELPLSVNTIELPTVYVCVCVRVQTQHEPTDSQREYSLVNRPDS